MSEALLDILAIAAHPDDAELFAGGTLALAAAAGRRVGILNLTRGEAATVGTPEARADEARRAAGLLGIDPNVRNLDLGDGQLANNDAQRAKLVTALRWLRPRLVLTHGAEDRHPDHPAAHTLVRDAVFFANVAGYKIEPDKSGHADKGDKSSERWKVEGIAYWLGNTFRPEARADWVVDVSAQWEKKIAALRAYATQFRGEAAGAAQTYIGSADYWEHLARRAQEWGHCIGAAYGEAFTLDRPAHAAHPLVRLTTPK